MGYVSRSVIDTDLAKAAFDTLAWVYAAIGDVLLKSDDTEYSQASGGYVKQTEITVPANVTSSPYRVKFDLKASAIANSYVGRGKIYKNSGAIGVERETTGTTYDTFSEDFAGMVGGDTIELHTRATGPGVNAMVRNFRVYSGVSSYVSLKTEPSW